MSRTLLRLQREAGISLEMPQLKRASSQVEWRISWFFWSCSSKRGVPLELPREPQGPALGASGKSILHASCKGPLGILLQSLPGLRFSSGGGPEPQSSSPVPTWISGFHWSFHRGEGLVSCGSIPIRSPLKLEKHCQASCRVDIGIGGFLSKCHKAVIPAIVF